MRSKIVRVRRLTAAFLAAAAVTATAVPAPRRRATVWGAGPAVTYAAAGFAAVAPDYLGLYTAYLLTSWNRVYGGIYRTPSEVFEDEYADRVEKYFDGTTPGPVMLKGLPGTLDELLKPRGLDLLSDPSGTFAEALRVDAEVCTAWTPRVPVRLSKMAADEQAVTANTDNCAVSFGRRGARVDVVDLDDTLYGGSRHLGSNLAGTAEAVRWFAALR